MAEATQTHPGEPPQYKKKPPIAANWFKGWLGLGLAHQAAMLEDTRKVLQQSRAAVAQHEHNTLGTPAPATGAEEEDVIHVGDRTSVQHVYPVPPTAPANSNGALFRNALVAASLLVGVAGGALGLASLLRPAAPPTIVNPAPAPADAKPQEWEIKWKLGPDGKWITEARPIRE